MQSKDKEKTKYQLHLKAGLILLRTDEKFEPAHEIMVLIT